MAIRITVAEAEAKVKEYLKRKFPGIKNIIVKSIDRTDAGYHVKGELTRKLLFLTLKRRFKIEIDGFTGKVKKANFQRRVKEERQA